MYSDLVQSYYQQPVHNSALDMFSVSRQEGNSVCGDHITVYLMIVDNVITDRGFDGDTSLITTAASGFFGDLVIGKTTDVVLSRGESIMIDEGFDVSSRRRRARVIALMATQNAIYEHLSSTKVVAFDDLII